MEDGDTRRGKLTAGTEEWFFWFLCSRWGTTASELGAMPESEFRRHYEFWCQYRWGLESDLIASLVRVTIRGVNLPEWSVKNAALAGSGVAAPVIPKAEDLWENLVSAFRSIGNEQLSS